ncbi:MAG: EAL domain-containing protein [Actinomycetota bacterium]|nr:EAL domain-containing protein [Actinomycetota bacterium]
MRELEAHLAEVVEVLVGRDLEVDLEITETVLMDDAPRALRVLRTLKSLGVRLSIDDFGTGYSSLTYVDSFPTDELKIDRSFIATVGEHGKPPIVLAVISLAHALDLDVVAEGVERAEQADQLRQMGCDTAQGYYWSRPLPPEDVAQLRERTRRGRSRQGDGTPDQAAVCLRSQLLPRRRARPER